MLHTALIQVKILLQQNMKMGKWVPQQKYAINYFASNINKSYSSENMNKTFKLFSKIA